MKKTLLASVVVSASAAFAIVLPPPPVVRPVELRADEQPVAVKTSSEAMEGNGLYIRSRTTIVFTNPNARTMSADLEFPLPDGATVCGYALEVNGEMVPGVVVEKEKARVAFESEKARNVDPGIVEHVKGNVWRTRIFPLLPNVPRKAQVEYIAPVDSGEVTTVYERDGADVFVGERVKPGEAASVSDRIAAFASGVVLWDASGSAEPFAAAWRERLAALPETGDWRLVVFRNDTEETRFTSRAALLDAIDSLVYDGGTDIALAIAAAGDSPALLFTDEADTLGLETPRYDDCANIFVASREESPSRAIAVRRLAPGETPPEGVEAKSSTLLATAWAAQRIADLSSMAENRRQEFLALGRRYGVASPVTSLVVLERLDQYLRHKIEPPAAMSFHDEWVRRRAAEDDQIADKEVQAEHERELLRLWKERVEWWLNPIPPKNTPSSGLFERVVNVARNDAFSHGASSADAEDVVEGMAVSREAVARAPAPGRYRRYRAKSVPGVAKVSSMAGAAQPTPAATIKIAAWNPKAPYLDALGNAERPYGEYLRQRKEHGSAPAFYMDCASWFFSRAAHEAAPEPFRRMARRILSNMAEFALEDAAVWRAMGWRLREAAEYDAAVRCFRKALALRGEEGQSRRDLALVLAECGKDARDPARLTEAMALLNDAAFLSFARRSARRSNDRQVSIIALEELNALMAWCEAAGVAATPPALDSAYRRDMPLAVRIVLSWSADETDIDLHVLEPDGEEAFYGHRRTSTGGFVSEDVTTGYGPEEYLRKEAKGKFKILTNYYASHQTALTGATTATATVYTNWGTAEEKREVITLRLDKPKDKQPIGEVLVD